jgi:transposase
MDICRATKASGDPCKAPATGPHGFCWAHDPANAEQRSRMASKAARSRPSRELVRVKAQLEDLTRDVLAGELETSRAAVANQLVNTRLRAIEQERKIKEMEDLEARIEALESKQPTMHPTKGVRRW